MAAKARHDRSQKLSNWFKPDVNGEMACKTRSKLEDLDANLRTQADDKIRQGCEHILVGLR